MKTKLEMAHDYAVAMIRAGVTKESATEFAQTAFTLVDAMQAEADKRDEEKASQKRKAIREMLNGDNTFLEKEGRHFDDVADMQKPHTSSEEWQQNQKTYDAKCSKCNSVSKFSRLDGSIHRNEINREFLCVSCPVCQSDVWVDL